MIKGIIFDCFGVLYHGSLEYLRTLAGPNHLRELNDLSHSSDAGYIDQNDYFEQVGLLLHKTPEEIDKICQEQHFRNELMFELLLKMKSHYKIGLLSNVGRGLINELFTDEELSQLFDVKVLSSEVGIVKPDQKIYQLTALKLGLEPEQCVMIDDVPLNIVGAERAGMKGIVCESTQQVIEELSLLLEGDYARTT